MSPLTLTTSHEQEAVRVSLSGELDISSALTFDDELRRIEDEAEPADVVLDLRELKFMDSTGMRLIIRAHQRVRRQGRRLSIEHLRAPIRRIFRLTGMHERLNVVDDRRARA
jgi:anti-sigma B factor antagonist